MGPSKKGREGEADVQAVARRERAGPELWGEQMVLRR
jgi:hypothetical protein